MPESYNRAGQARDSNPGQRREAEKREGKHGFCCPTLQACQGNGPLTNQQILTELLPDARQEPKKRTQSEFVNTILFQSKPMLSNTRDTNLFLASFRDKLSFLTCLLSTNSNNSARSYSYYRVPGTVLVSRQLWQIESVSFSVSMTLAGWLPCPSYHGYSVLPRPLTLG